MSYTKDHLEKLNTFEVYKVTIDAEVAKLIEKNVPNGKLFIGNMIYSTLGSMVTYCYFSDYMNGKRTFYPVWDRDNSGDFGWGDFTQCCRIYDVIIKNIENIC